MGLSQGKFLGSDSISLSSIMILPIFSVKAPAGFPQWGNTLHTSDYGKKQDAAVEDGIYPFVSFPSKVAPELVLHLLDFRRN